MRACAPCAEQGTGSGAPLHLGWGPRKAGQLLEAHAQRVEVGPVWSCCAQQRAAEALLLLVPFLELWRVPPALAFDVPSSVFAGAVLAQAGAQGRLREGGGNRRHSARLNQPAPSGNAHTGKRKVGCKTTPLEVQLA